MSNKKQKIIETAFTLFSENGFYATGIDQIIRESGTSKKTLYTYFSSKTDLVEAVLGYYREMFLKQMAIALNDIDDAEAKLFRVFDIAHGWYTSKKFNGCLAIGAMNEYGGKDDALRAACLEFKMVERNLIRTILAEMKVEKLDKVTDYLMILLEGMTATAHMESANPEVDDIKGFVRDAIGGIDCHTAAAATSFY